MEHKFYYFAFYIPVGGEITVGSVVEKDLGRARKEIRTIQSEGEIDPATQVLCKLHVCTNKIKDGDLIGRYDLTRTPCGIAKDAGRLWEVTYTDKAIGIAEGVTGAFSYKEMITTKWYKILCPIPDYITRYKDGDEISVDSIDEHESNFYIGGSIDAPFNDDEVARLNQYQELGFVHEFTCGSRDENHPEDNTLIATNEGWKCPSCDYTQKWAHMSMLNIDGIKKDFERFTIPS